MKHILYHYLKQIEAQPSLEPNPQTNALFSNLVHTVLNASSRGTLLPATERKKLQQLCGYAEYLLELHWCKKILASGKKETLEEFPYLRNYRDLTTMEVGALIAAKNNGKRFVFIGGGPLPLTALLLAREFHKEVVVLDTNKEAVTYGQQLIACMGLEQQVRCIHAPGEEFKEYHTFDVICIAALAGIDGKVKQAILNAIRSTMRPDALVLARSSWGARQNLYKPVYKRELKGFTTLLELHPHNHVVNSVLLFKKT